MGKKKDLISVGKKEKKAIKDVKSTKTSQKEENKGGRPRVHFEAMTKTTLVLPEHLMEKTEFTTRVYAGGRSEYITNLIIRDLAEKDAEYEKIREMLETVHF